MKKIGLICLALVVALGSLGAAYALWSETLTIGGQVEAGEVEVIFTSEPIPPYDVIPTTNDPSNLDPAAFGRDPPRRDKNVGDSSLGVMPKSIILGAHNTYPSYRTTGWAPIKNIGTIPVKIQKFLMRIKFDWRYSDDGAASWTDVAADAWVPIAVSTTRLVDIDKDGDVDYSVHIVNPVEGTQIDPGGIVWMDINLHVEQGASENRGWIAGGVYDYVFYISMQAVQWNEFKP